LGIRVLKKMTIFGGLTLAFCIERSRREKEWELKQNLIKEELPELDERLIETELGEAAKV